jgi:sulfur carrier protein ThiS
VYHEFGSKFHVLECGKEKREFNSRDDVLQSLQFNEDTVAYEFNNQMYADLY